MHVGRASEQREPSLSRIPIGESDESDFSGFDRSGETIESSTAVVC